MPGLGEARSKSIPSSQSLMARGWGASVTAGCSVRHRGDTSVLQSGWRPVCSKQLLSQVLAPFCCFQLLVAAPHLTNNMGCVCCAVALSFHFPAWVFGTSARPTTLAQSMRGIRHQLQAWGRAGMRASLSSCSEMGVGLAEQGRTFCHGHRWVPPGSSLMGLLSI